MHSLYIFTPRDVGDVLHLNALKFLKHHLICNRIFVFSLSDKKGVGGFTAFEASERQEDGSGEICTLELSTIFRSLGVVAAVGFVRGQA